MGRPKGFKLSDEQKARLREGKKKAREKMGNEIKDDSKTDDSNTKQKSPIAGFGLEPDDDRFITPIFNSEVSTWKRKIFKTAGEARDALNKRNERKANHG